MELNVKVSVLIPRVKRVLLGSASYNEAPSFACGGASFIDLKNIYAYGEKIKDPIASHNC
jgi:hypothetical protein